MQAFNKVDVVRPDFALEWIQDLNKLQRALDADDTYAATLSRSLALVLEEFYANLRHVGVSSVTGEGMPELFEVRGFEMT
jgi:GPN-loop GTPase